MAKRDLFAEEMQKAEREGIAQRENAKRLAARRKRAARIRMWCVVTLLVSGTALTIVYRVQVSTCMTTVWSAVSSGSTNATSSLPFVKSFTKAKQTIGDAKAVNHEREKLLDDLNP